MKGRPHSEEGTQCSTEPNWSSDHALHLKEKRLGLTDSLSPETSATSASPSHFLSPHPAPLLSQPVHGERKTFLAVAKRPLGSNDPATRPHALPGATHPGQSVSSKPPSQVPNLRGRGNSFSPDWSCLTAFRARLSTLCSHCFNVAVPVRAFWASVPPHISQTRSLTTMDSALPPAAKRSKPINAHALSDSAETQGIWQHLIHSHQLLLYEEEKELAMRPILPWNGPLHGRCAQTHAVPPGRSFTHLLQNSCAPTTASQCNSRNFHERLLSQGHHQ